MESLIGPATVVASLLVLSFGAGHVVGEENAAEPACPDGVDRLESSATGQLLPGEADWYQHNYVFNFVRADAHVTYALVSEGGGLAELIVWDYETCTQEASCSGSFVNIAFDRVGHVTCTVPAGSHFVEVAWKDSAVRDGPVDYALKVQQY